MLRLTPKKGRSGWDGNVRDRRLKRAALKQVLLLPAECQGRGIVGYRKVTTFLLAIMLSEKNCNSQSCRGGLPASFVLLLFGTFADVQEPRAGSAFRVLLWHFSPGKAWRLTCHHAV